jgi:hypothetical protein
VFLHGWLGVMNEEQLFFHMFKSNQTAIISHAGANISPEISKLDQLSIATGVSWSASAAVQTHLSLFTK